MTRNEQGTEQGTTSSPLPLMQLLSKNMAKWIGSAEDSIS